MGIQLLLLGLALIAGMRKQYPRTARFYGAWMHYRDRPGFGIYATEQSLHDRIVLRVESARNDRFHGIESDAYGKSTPNDQVI